MQNFPDWNRFTPQFVEERMPELLAAADKAVSEIENLNPSSYDELIPKLDDATREVGRTWGMLTHMTSVMNSEEWRKLEEKFQPGMIAFSLRTAQSEKIYSVAKKILDSSAFEGETGAIKKRILNEMVKSAEHAGIALKGEKRERFNAIRAELAKLAMDFSNAVLDATNAFRYEKNGVNYTIDDANYPQTMKECADREVREVLYRARASRAGDNTPRITKILALKRELAVLLGFEDYAALSIDAKSAPSVKAVYDMFDELDSATVKIADEEKKELESLAAEFLGEGVKAEPWDFAYLAERLREKKYSYSEEELKKYFEVEDVFAGLFKMTKFLFGVDVVELKGDDKPSVWHEDVRFFALKENGEDIAWFYADPFVRNGLKRGGAWMNEFGNRNDRLGLKPVALMALNFPERDKNGKCYLPFREVETVFHEFGHALQCMLTRIGEEDAAGINLVEWDAVEVASQFMENWCLDGRTGLKVPEDLKKRVLAAKNFRAASFCRRQLALGKTDMDLYTAKTEVDPDAVKRSVFTHFGMPLTDDDRFLCSFTHIFGGGYAAGYYSYKWSEIMSADAYGAFEEAGLDNDEALQAVGRRLRETIYGLGGSKSAYDVFIEFRGRRSEVEPLLRQQGFVTPVEKPV